MLHSLFFCTTYSCISEKHYDCIKASKKRKVIYFFFIKIESKHIMSWDQNKEKSCIWLSSCIMSTTQYLIESKNRSNNWSIDQGFFMKTNSKNNSLHLKCRLLNQADMNKSKRKKGERKKFAFLSKFHIPSTYYKNWNQSCTFVV